MEATQSYPNLLSEKQAAARLGVARITLLRAREGGRIRFFRIGTRVLYCEEQLTEFLNSCERNARKDQDELHPDRRVSEQRLVVDVGRAVNRIGRPRVQDRIVDAFAGVLDVENLVAEGAQAEQVHQRTPGDAAERISGDDGAETTAGRGIFCEPGSG